MDERGFTMIELLMVVLIVGILAALALPAFLGQADKARDTTTKADVRNAVSQMEACFAEPESYGPCPDAEHALGNGVSLTVTGGGTARSCTRPGQGGWRSNSSW